MFLYYLVVCVSACTARSAAAAAAANVRQIAAERKSAITAHAHSHRLLATTMLTNWRILTRHKRARSARVREGALFQTYLLYFSADGTRLFMQHQGRLAIRAGTGAGAGALMWMLAARHAWLRTARHAFAALHARHAEATAAYLGYHSGDRELMYRGVLGWVGVARKARLVKMKSEEAQRMRARRLLALARGTLLGWRRQLAIADKLRLRLQGMRLRRETGDVRRLWFVWCMVRGHGFRQEHLGVQDELGILRDDIEHEQERANASDAACKQLADKLQLLSSDKATVECDLTETKRKFEDLSIALEEASVVEKDLRLQLERERFEQEQLLVHQQSLRGEVAGSHTEAVAASASLAMEKENMAFAVESMRSQLNEVRDELQVRDEQVELCQSTLRETLEKLESTSAKAREDADRAAQAHAELHSHMSDRDTEIGLLKEQLRHVPPYQHSRDSPATSALPMSIQVEGGEGGVHTGGVHRGGIQNPFPTAARAVSLLDDGQSVPASSSGHLGESASLLSTAQLLQKQHDFAKRKHAIDAQYRGRLAGVGAFATSRDIQGPLLVRQGRGGHAVDENVAPNLLHIAPSMGLKVADGQASGFGGGGYAGLGGLDFSTPSPEIAATEHQQVVKMI